MNESMEPLKAIMNLGFDKEQAQELLDLIVANPIPYAILGLKSRLKDRDDE